jgi:hypothetical protein
LLLRMSSMRCCLNVAVMLFASAIAGLAAPFGVRVFLVGGHAARTYRGHKSVGFKALLACGGGRANVFWLTGGGLKKGTHARYYIYTPGSAAKAAH